jgi:methylated-DNA-[protein]-cysteine S-methyltransferase
VARSFAHAVVSGPWGPINLAATGRGVVAVEWLDPVPGFEDRVRRRLERDGSAGPDIDTPEAHLEIAVTAVHAILTGRPPAVLPAFDLADRPAWDRAVLLAVADIPWGATTSYGDIARRIGSPRAARAVGGAVGRNPIGLLIPCHRVIAADGTIGGYGGDAWGARQDHLAVKRGLLMREGVTLRAADR